MNMSDKNHLEGISFRFLQPKSRFLSKSFYKYRLTFQWPFECLNTRFDKEAWEPGRIKKIKKLSRMPKMSTLAIGALINRLVSELSVGQAYLNIGVWHGFSLLAGMAGNPAKKCIGVDNFSEFGSPRPAFLKRFAESKSPLHEFYDADWREYLKKSHHGSVGIYFYDGSHDYDSQYQALVSAGPFMASGGYILVDDTNWESPRKAMADFLARFPDYELVFDVRTAGNCHPTFWNGLMIAQKRIG
ncbi:hypothetical protein A3C52_04145 [Candidatus Peribacteria bacterium RIFCSPHIGHO2_02_FULL_51_15]|nr:MAG: hypothetical protein A3C52_04145 [Candidatus Peribacteria bacterium RIFCSPHIGHO2_02_FULL_51_15]